MSGPKAVDNNNNNNNNNGDDDDDDQINVDLFNEA